MEPTMLVGDFVLVNKQVFADPGHFRWLLPFRDPRIDDIIVFHYPVNPRELLVKRVIALPGDRIHLQNGHVLRNDVRVLEPFAVYRPAERSPFRDEFPNLQRTDPAVQATWWIELRHRMQYGALPVPPNRYFALGDNRNNSQDSRYWGFVARSTIIGEPLAIYLSVDRSPQASGGKPSRGRIRWNRLLHVVY
jgi:signal peptidase I